MRSLVVYDSYFGNTKKIAEAVVVVLAKVGEVKMVLASEASVKDLNGLDLLVVGSPTRACRPTKAISDFINKIPNQALSGKKVAVFDTQIDPKDIKSRFFGSLINFFGYAAKPMANKLKKKGGILAEPPEGFFVKESQGPLKDGEVKRAASWATSIL